MFTARTKRTSGPGQSKAASVNGLVRTEDNEKRWTGWCNCRRRSTSTESATWRWVVAGAVVQRYAVI